MSGWRSHSGDHSIDLDANAFGVQPAPTGRGRTPPTRREWLGLIVLALAVAGLLAFGWYSREQHRPARRALPAAIHPAVLIVPMGAFPLDRLQDLPHDYGTAYDLSMTIAEPIALPATAFDVSRRQYVAEDLIAAMRQVHPPAGDPSTIVIGVTTADVYIRGIDWDWAFALRQEGTSAVISVARMPNTKQVNRWKLFATMMTRQVGFLCFGLPPSDNPYDVLYRDILSVSDLDRLFDQL
jgi:predicted Zn-dependent protease